MPIFFSHRIIETCPKGLKLHQNSTDCIRLDWDSGGFRRSQWKTLTITFYSQGPGGGYGQGMPAVGLGGPQQRIWRSPEGSGHLQRQPGRHRSVKTPPNNSPGHWHQAQISLLPQMAVGRATVPCSYLTLGSRDWSQLWHFYHCLRATLKTILFW